MCCVVAPCIVSLTLLEGLLSLYHPCGLCMYNGSDPSQKPNQRLNVYVLYSAHTFQPGKFCIRRLILSPLESSDIVVNFEGQIQVSHFSQIQNVFFSG